MDALTFEQRQALEQIRDLTNGGDDDVAISILESVGWDVQKAADVLFSGGGPPPASSSNGTAATEAKEHTTQVETFEVDDTEQGYSYGTNGHASSNQHTNSGWSIINIPRPIISFLTFPFHFLSSILRFVFGVLRIPIPQFSLLNIMYSRRPRRPTQRRGPDAWIRELEEETGAVCIGRYNNARGVVASGAEAGPSTVVSRGAIAGTDAEESRKVLPDFYQGSYEQALRLCQKELRIACVVLVSEEHDDVMEFKRDTLTDPTFVKTLQENDILVWGGDVRDHDAWSAAEKLQATTYPFVAFVSLQATRNVSSTISSRSLPTSPSMTVLSRHQGPCSPSSAPTSAASLVGHLQRQVLPRVGPFLERLKAAQRERDVERRLREEQDQAFAAAARRDKERIEARIEEERLAKERKRQQEEREAIEAAKRLSEAEARQRAEERKMAWRRWSRKNLVSGEVPNGRNTVRLAIRLPDNRRVVRAFPSTASLTALYIYIDSHMLPPQLTPDADPSNPPEGTNAGEAALEEAMRLSGESAEEWWGFKIVNAYPRQEVPWSSKTLAEVDCLRGGGQIVVELLSSRRTSLERTERADGDDGYGTESDDE